MNALLLTLFLITSPAPPPRVADLIFVDDLLNDKCRGGSGDSPETMKACELRDRVTKQIEAAGWCWGHGGQSEAEKVWEPCSVKKQAPTVGP